MGHGIFKNSALGNAGIFAGGSALGSLSGGVFEGPTALGTPALGASADVKNINCKLDCVAAWAGSADSDYHTARCKAACDVNYPPYTTLEPEVTTWGKVDSTSGIACASDAIIALVQSKIGAAIDGKWGPESQRKLTASGQSFQALAPGCTPPVPSYWSEDPSGDGYILPTPQPTQPAVVAPPEAQAGMLTGITGALTQKFAGLPVGVWGLGIFVLTAGAVAVAREKGWV